MHLLHDVTAGLGGLHGFNADDLKKEKDYKFKKNEFHPKKIDIQPKDGMLNP